MKELVSIQSKLKAPKNQRNSFGNYNYRNAEDILEALKPLLKESECYLTISDDIIVVDDRFYVKATATITNKEDKSVSVSAFARETLSKKGMDESQITGSTSSYARKYALNGLFCIDDTKDSDHNCKHDDKETEEDKRNNEICGYIKAVTTKFTDDRLSKLLDMIRELPEPYYTDRVRQFKAHIKQIGHSYIIKD